MPAYTTQGLSAATTFQGINITSTASTGNLIHNMPISNEDRVWMWASNRDSSDRTLTVAIEGVLTTSSQILNIPTRNGLNQIFNGLTLKSSGVTEIDIRAWASVTNTISIFGYVMRQGTTGPDKLYTTEVISGGDGDGSGINVVATASAGNTAHTAAGTNGIDKVYLYATNLNAAADRVLTVEWSGTGAEDRFAQTIPFRDGLILLSPGLCLPTGASILVFADVTTDVNIWGEVYREVDP